MAEARQATKQVIRNSAHLLAMQAANYVLPLLSFPYLILTLGAAPYGQVLFANSVISFVITFADFGLNITATEHVSKHREEPAELQSMVNQTVLIRFLLCLGMGLLWTMALLLVPKFHDDPWLYGLTFAMVPAQVLNPSFFFQGRDQMGIYSRLVIFSKVMFTLAIFLLVTLPAQYMWVNVLNASCTALANIVGWVLVSRHLRGSGGFRFQLPGKLLLQQSWYIMVGQMGQNTMGAAYTVIAGFFVPPAIYGKFALADKLIWPFHQLIGAGFQATFAQVSKLMYTSRVQAGLFLGKLKLVFGGIGLLGIAGSLVLAPYVVQFLNKGVEDADATHYLRLLSPLILIAAIRVPYQQILFAGQKKLQYTKIIVGANVLSLGLNLWAVQVWGIPGVIAATVFVECLILISYWVVSRSVSFNDMGDATLHS